MFLRYPVLLRPDVLSLKGAMSLLVKSIGLYVLFTLLYLGLMAILSFFFNLKISEFGSKTTNWYKYIILAPVIEELIFRLPLRNFFKNIFVAFGLLIYVFAKSYLSFGLAISASVVVMSLPYITIFIGELELKVNSFVYHHYGFLFYFFAFSFGLLHLTNAGPFTSDMYLSAFIYVINPLLIGFYFAFIRIKFKYGIIYSIIIHTLTNFLHFLPSLLSK